MEMSVSSEMTFFNMKLQLEICPQQRTGSSAEDRGRIDTSLCIPLWLAFREGSMSCLWPLPRLLLVCTNLICVLFVVTPTSTISLYYFSICTLLKYEYCLWPPYYE